MMNSRNSRLSAVAPAQQAQQAHTQLHLPASLSCASAASAKTEAISADAKEPDNKNHWLFNPLADLLFCCGGLVFLLIGLHFLISPAAFQSGPDAVEIIPFLTALGTILLSDTHNAATLFRLYGSKKMREKHRGLSRGGAVAAAMLFATLLFSTPLLSLCARVYLLLVVYHVLAQLYGITLMYCRMQNCHLDKKDKLLLKLGIDSLAAYAIFCQFAYAENFRHSFFGIALPIWSGLPKSILYTVLAVSVCLLIAFAYSITRKKLTLPLPALMLLSSGLLIASLVHCASGVLSLYIPIFFHGLQYLMINLSQHLKNTSCSAASQRQSGLAISLNYSGKLLAITFCLFGLLPQFICLLANLQFANAFLAVFLAVNFHHILTDSVIWRQGSSGRA